MVWGLATACNKQTITLPSSHSSLCAKNFLRCVCARVVHIVALNSFRQSDCLIAVMCSIWMHRSRMSLMRKIKRENENKRTWQTKRQTHTQACEQKRCVRVCVCVCRPHSVRWASAAKTFYYHICVCHYRYIYNQTSKYPARFAAPFHNYVKKFRGQ